MEYIALCKIPMGLYNYSYILYNYYTKEITIRSGKEIKSNYDDSIANIKISKDNKTLYYIGNMFNLCSKQLSYVENTDIVVRDNKIIINNTSNIYIETFSVLGETCTRLLFEDMELQGSSFIPLAIEKITKTGEVSVSKINLYNGIVVIRRHHEKGVELLILNCISLRGTECINRSDIELNEVKTNMSSKINESLSGLRAKSILLGKELDIHYIENNNTSIMIVSDDLIMPKQIDKIGFSLSNYIIYKANNITLTKTQLQSLKYNMYIRLLYYNFLTHDEAIKKINSFIRKNVKIEVVNG